MATQSRVMSSPQLSHGIRAICLCIMRSIHPYLSAPSSITSLTLPLVLHLSRSLHYHVQASPTIPDPVTLTDSLQYLSHLPSTICNVVDPPHPSQHLSEVLYTSSALFSASPVLEISVMHHAASPALVFILPGFYWGRPSLSTSSAPSSILVDLCCSSICLISLPLPLFCHSKLCFALVCSVLTFVGAVCTLLVMLKLWSARVLLIVDKCWYSLLLSAADLSGYVVILFLFFSFV